MTLECRDVILEPLDPDHAQGLLDAGRDGAIWRYMPADAFETIDDSKAWIRNALDEQNAGDRLAFAIVDPASGRAIGSTSYLEIRRRHRSLEIGWTWITPAFQRTGVNTQCKQALLAHAFDTLGAVRVQFKTDLRNIRSQRAIERIGGTREGTLRQSLILPSGYVRDSVYFSILDSEWPAVRERLAHLVG